MTLHLRPQTRLLRHVALSVVVVLCASAVADVSAASAADPSPVAALPTFAMPPDTELASDGAQPLTDQPIVPTEIDLAAIGASGVAAATALTGAQWNLTDLEWSLQGDPYAAFAFVRDHIAFQPYSGVLRGPDGTLAARAGNAFDRALLLKTLLDSMLVPARFAFAQLDDTSATLVAARTFAAPTSALQQAGTAAIAPLDPTVILTRARRDYARIRLALGDRLNALQATGNDHVLAETKQHVWVQMAAGPTWVDLDTTMPDATPGHPLVVATSTAEAIPPEDFQTVDLQLVAQTDTDGQIAERTVLRHQFTAATDAISEAFLYFQPDVSGLGGTILNTLTGIQNFQAELMVNGIVQSGDPFIVSASGTDIFGNPSGSSAELAGLRLQIVARPPSEPDATAVKQLLDRVPPAMAGQTAIPLNQLIPLAADKGGAIALQSVHHILISTGGADPRDHAIQKAAVADFGAELADPEIASQYALKDILWPMAVSDKLLALASERAIVDGLSDRSDVRAVIAQPRVYVTSIGADTTAPDGFSFATDLALDGVRIVSAGSVDQLTLARYQVWYGALQTGLESEFGLRAAGTFDAAGRNISGASFATSGAQSLTLLDANSIPAAAAPALLAALHAGQIVLVPGDPATTQVWWTVGADGVTRSILAPGLGGGKYTGRSQQPPRPKGGSSGYGNKFKYQRPTEPPSRCSGGQEYTLLLGCISLPAAWALRVTVFVAVTIATQYAWTTLVINPD